jgi:tetratricopeptide (TPR) repeat protein
MCQQKKLDSLLLIIKDKPVNIDNYYKALVEAGDMFTDINKNDTAIFLFNKAQKLAAEKKDSLKIVELMIKKGICLDQKGAYRQSAESYFSALAIAERKRDDKLQVKALLTLSYITSS